MQALKRDKVTFRLCPFKKHKLISHLDLGPSLKYLLWNRRAAVCSSPVPHLGEGSACLSPVVCLLFMELFWHVTLAGPLLSHSTGFCPAQHLLELQMCPSLPHTPNPTVEGLAQCGAET